MKDSWYFPHDFHARDDLNVQKIVMEMGMEGVGIYWCLIEIMHENAGCIMRSQCDCIAFALRVQCDRILWVLEKSDCFLFDEEKFWSERVLKNLQMKKNKIEASRNAAKSRWNNATAMQAQCDSNARAMRQQCQKEKKRKEKKDIKENLQKKSFSALDEFDYSCFADDEVIAIKKWFSYKSERKQEYKSKIGLGALRNTLKKLSEKKNLIQSIEWSMSRGWDGIYEQKNENQHAKQLQIQQQSHFQSHLIGLAEGARAIQEREERERQSDVDRDVSDFSENEASLEQF